LAWRRELRRITKVNGNMESLRRYGEKRGTSAEISRR
jgi:hypothetical protein